VFLDPDTGIEPETAKAEHVTVADMREIWSELHAGDILAVYQHADRSGSWQQDRAMKLSEACGGAKVEVIQGRAVAQDIAVLWCRKV
jgi:fatty acid-binding protein DegV